MKYAVFGAGDYGQQTVDYLEDIAFFMDNNPDKSGTEIKGIPVYLFSECVSDLKQYKVVIAVSNRYLPEIEAQLRAHGITEYDTYFDVKREYTKKKILSRVDNLSVYKRAINWINDNTIKYDMGMAIANGSKIQYGYPEVTGYYIPTLIRWGKRDLAIDYAKWLVAIQKEDGSWYDTYDKEPYVFDTAQIMKGLISVRKIYPHVDASIVKGCNWLISHIDEAGRFRADDEHIWKSSSAYSELIHLYCLSPLMEAGEIFDNEEYISKAKLSLEYYKKNHYEDIIGFGLLSHFYAYVMEALVDMGEIELAKEAMDKIAELQTENGCVPAYKNVHWVCSTGLFQLALVWFRLGEIERGNKAFKFACSLQNESGGWYGSYLTGDVAGEDNDYFPDGEISWAVKYFLDALYYKNKAECNVVSKGVLPEIKSDDGRYVALKNVVLNATSVHGGSCLDVGCGKGRYISKLSHEFPNSKFYGIDISDVLVERNSKEYSGISFASGTLTNIPYDDNSFDVVYACESLEHAIDIEAAIGELCRVTKSGGKVVVIDKNTEALGALEIGPWEQWFSEDGLKKILLKHCSEVQVISDVDYENKPVKGLFYIWVATK